MSGDVGTEAPRPRPLSGGLWTLFSWLRRDEHASSDSLSSVGSDRTVASFAYLAPALYGAAEPAPRPPPPPPTDSYKKRVRDRNLRRQHDRDITLHRKYGLYGFGYDALSLPSGRRAPGDRERRAASESPRAHVPGKRRAPPPPSGPATLPRHRARKRPAPLPPITPIKENIDEDAADVGEVEPMNRPLIPEGSVPRNPDGAMGCKPEKYSKKDAQNKETKDVKIRHEKSFLKHIFENRKRNSAIETASVKLLPNISELDKQAAEIIEKYRLKELGPSDALDKELMKNEPSGSSKHQVEAWICTRCLRKYNSSVITCNYCLPLNKLNGSYKSSKASNNFTQTNNIINNPVPGSSSGRVESKEKLKEMLKEMKDSLPKRLKNDLSTANNIKNTSEMELKEDYPKVVEAPTLRIGSSTCTDKNPIAQTSSAHRFEELSSPLGAQDINRADKKALTTINSVVITQPVVLVHTKESNVVLNTSNTNKGDTDKLMPSKNDSAKPLIDSGGNISQIVRTKASNNPHPLNISSKTKHDLNTPLKISSLLNPFYIPKITSATNTPTPKLVKETDSKNDNIQNVTSASKFATKAANAASVVNSAAQPILPSQPPTRKTPPREEKKILELKKNAGEENGPASNIKIAHVKAEVKEIQHTEANNKQVLVTVPPSVDVPSSSTEIHINQHTRRRDLINQLEQSIAKGDEHAAAEAAVKLAQLRLSCSVLSFSSQIVAEQSSSTPQKNNVSKLTNKAKCEKVEEAIQKSSQINIDPVKSVPAKQSPEKIVMRHVDRPVDKGKPILKKEENKTIILPKLDYTNTKSNCETKGAITQKPVLSEASTSKDVTRKENDDEGVPILVWVEDKEATRGPVQLHVRRNAVIGDLRGQAERSLGLAARMQRWIVGRTLCTDDNTPLVTLAGPELSAPFYLCLVESDTKDTAKPQVELKINEDAGNRNVYNELMKLEKQPLVLNAEVFECGVCIEECAPGCGVILRECVHSFCKDCLSGAVRHSEEPAVSCPAMGCRGVLQEREIRGLVSPDDYEKWLARGLAAAESGTRNAFHCRTRDCTGWALCDPGVRRFHCPVCKSINCVPCQAIHEGETCEQHSARLKESAAGSDVNRTDDEGTQALLKTLIARGEALECPECSAIITKKWGCDWVKCSACKTEICWVTRGRRWGPAGRGDTSGGCRCGVDGKRCHPSCGYCH